MKLNYKTTILIGLAFMSITAFWQLYDNVIPLLLTNTFHLNETISGAIMAADNILALFLLPFFGRLSDKTETAIGKRMPYILGGTFISVMLLNVLPIIENSYAAGNGGPIFSFGFFVFLDDLRINVFLVDPDLIDVFIEPSVIGDIISVFAIVLSPGVLDLPSIWKTFFIEVNSGEGHRVAAGRGSI